MYTFPNELIINEMQIPYYLGIGLINPRTIIVEDDLIKADYFEQQQGELTKELTARVLMKNNEVTLTRYFEGNPFKESTKNTFSLAFFLAHQFKKEGNTTTFIEDKPVLKLANEVMQQGAHTFLYTASNLYFPSGFLVKIHKPLLDEKTKVLWKSFVKKFKNSVDPKNQTILKNGHSPFSKIEADGNGMVLPVFLKDAIALIKEHDLMGDTKETALIVSYV